MEVGELRWSWLASTLMLAVACASGAKTDDTTTFGPGPASGAPQTTGARDTDDGDDESATTFTEDEGSAEGFGTTGPLGDGTTTGSLDEGTTTDDEGSSSDDGGPVGNCSNGLTCPTASSIGNVSGDTGSDSVDASGSVPTWLTFRVTEDDDALTGTAMSFTATLTSPAGADFDLFVYRGLEGGGSGCGGFMEQSTNGGAFDDVYMLWGEGLLANGVDDSAWVAVEIVPKNDMCAPPQEWTLVVVGNN